MLAERHYENFPVGSRWIAARLRPDIHALYAFARTADDFADEAEHEGHRVERLAVWRELLYNAAAGRADHPVFTALRDAIRKHRIPLEWLDNLIRAFEQDVRQNRHPTFDSILEYARRSANPVGRIVLWLHGYRDETLFSLSDDICTALQFANFWQDVGVDFQKNRIYLPQDDMAKFAYTEDDLAKGVVDGRFRGLLQVEIDRTRALFERGRRLCDLVNRDLRMELRLVHSGGTRILERIVRADFDVFRRRPTLGRRDKSLMLWRAFFWKPSAPAKEARA